MTRPRLIIVGPLPPPVHGVAVSTQLALNNPVLAERFRVEHVDTSDPRPIGTIGSWDARNAALALSHAAGLTRRLRGEKGLVYLPLSQGTAGFLRDSLLVHAAAISGWRVAAHLRGGEFLDFYQRQSVPWRLWIRTTLGRVHSVAVLSPRLRWMFSGFLPKTRIAVVPNGTPDVLSTAGDVGRGDHSVLYLSNLRLRKGVERALEAALIVLERLPEARFVFVGEWQSPEVERDLTARAAPWRDRIRFLPPATGEAKTDLLRSAAVFLFPPVEPEGHPRVVLEAVSAGLPVVTTDRGAIPDTVIDGETGFVLPEPDPRELADRLLRLLTDEELRRRMGEAARARYLERFTQERADRALADWLAEVSG